jgi:membrane-associated phospholipid phosphatase
LRWLWHGACGLILISTLTTWQHDLLDVLAGLLVGALALRITRCVPPSLGRTG